MDTACTLAGEACLSRPALISRAGLERSVLLMHTAGAASEQLKHCVSGRMELSHTLDKPSAASGHEQPESVGSCEVSELGLVLAACLSVCCAACAGLQDQPVPTRAQSELERQAVAWGRVLSPSCVACSVPAWVVVCYSLPAL
jgi:hypothetical protein